MAAEAKDARGLYEYSLYLRESLDFNSEYREICDEITELNFTIDYDDRSIDNIINRMYNLIEE